MYVPTSDVVQALVFGHYLFRFVYSLHNNSALDVFPPGPLVGRWRAWGKDGKWKGS